MIESRAECFPINSVESLYNYICFEIDQTSPCLALVSIVLGFYETALSFKRRKVQDSSPAKSASSGENLDDSDATTGVPFPTLEFTDVKSLFARFAAFFQAEDFLSDFNTTSLTDRERISIVADVVWRTLAQKFCRDKPHIQSLYAFITHHQSDAFGVSFATVAACQHLGLENVHLCLTEDHSWVSFGSETAEVTWHGKTGEERRGNSVSDKTGSNCWVYLNDMAIVCTDRKMEVAAVINAMNPIVEAGADSLEIVTIQYRLLDHFFKKGVIDKFPMAISNLANLTELLQSADDKAVADMFQMGIGAGRKFYSNRHVYPYTYYGSYLLRNSCPRAAIWCWAEAANVLSSYSYNREDEEVYKEMYEFAVDILPNLFKLNGDDVCEIFTEPLSFALLLKFYDGLCLWEEDSHTPVLHVKWARAMFLCLSKFSADVRASVKLVDKSKNGVTECMSSENVISQYKTKVLSEIEKQALIFLTDVSSSCLLWQSGDSETISVSVLLTSAKMGALKDLLFADRLQPAAIQLQLTAQTTMSVNPLSQKHKLDPAASSEVSPEQTRASKRRRFVTPQ